MKAAAPSHAAGQSIPAATPWGRKAWPPKNTVRLKIAPAGPPQLMKPSFSQ
jgi:hypothetical protein